MMRKWKETILSCQGFSILETMIVLVLFGIAAAIAVPSYTRIMADHLLTQYGNSVEYLVRNAKIMAMEKTTNIGVCVGDSKTLTLYDMGTGRSAGACSGTAVMTVTIASGDADNHNISVTGSAAAFDPRGFAISTGNVCVSNGSKYYKAVINRTGVRMENKTGACS